MRGLNPSPGVWRVLASAGAIEVEGDMTPVLDAEAVDYDGSVKFDIHNPDDAIVIRYAGELFRRARAVQVARVEWEACFSKPVGYSSEEKWSDRQKRLNDVVVEKQDHLEALLDEMRREAGDGP